LLWGPLVFRALLGDFLPRPVWVAVYYVGSVLIGIVATRVVELPFLALRDRLLPSRS
jgi:hypothetical protein